jgi:pre-mRNA-splicing factor 18
MNVYEHTMSELKSFLKVLQHRGGDKNMILSIYHIMNCCLVREYVQANDKYIQLSIGNAPWPMGIAMLSITVKRNEDKLTHVLND